MNGNASLSKLSEFKTSSSSSSLNQQQPQQQLQHQTSSGSATGGGFDVSSFMSKKSHASGSTRSAVVGSGDKPQTNGHNNNDHNNADDFGLFVSKIESKPDDSARAQYLTNQLNSKSDKANNPKKKV